MAKRGLNLIRVQLAPPTSWDNVYKWMLTSARMIIIGVEVVVMIAFVFRIAVDTQANNLNKEIESANAELAAYKNQEFIFRRIQDKTNLYRELWAASSNKSAVMSFINNLVKDLSGELSIAVEDREATIRGVLPVSRINDLELELKSAAEDVTDDSPVKFRKVELVEINSQGNSGNQVAEFFIRIELVDSEEKRSL